MPLTIRPAIHSEAAAILQLTLDAYAPYRDRLHPPSGVFRETVDDGVQAIEEGAVCVSVTESGALVGAVRVRASEVDSTGAGDVSNALYWGRLAAWPSGPTRSVRASARC